MINTEISIDIRSAAALIEHMVDPQAEESILDDVTAMILNRIRKRFLAETDPEGVPWIPSRAALRRRGKGGTGTLFDTGRLFRSIQAAATGPNQRKISTDVPYAAHHQFGIGQVQRVFLGFSAEDVELANQLTLNRVQQWLRGEANA